MHHLQETCRCRERKAKGKVLLKKLWVTYLTSFHAKQKKVTAVLQGVEELFWTSDYHNVIIYDIWRHVKLRNVWYPRLSSENVFSPLFTAYHWLKQVFACCYQCPLWHHKWLNSRPGCTVREGPLSVAKDTDNWQKILLKWILNDMPFTLHQHRECVTTRLLFG